MTDQRDPAAARPACPCPICGKPRLEAYKPFCSKRCADVDLHRWLGGAYAIPAESQEIGEEIESDFPRREG